MAEGLVRGLLVKNEIVLLLRGPRKRDLWFSVPRPGIFSTRSSANLRLQSSLQAQQHLKAYRVGLEMKWIEDPISAWHLAHDLAWRQRATSNEGGLAGLEPIHFSDYFNE